MTCLTTLISARRDTLETRVGHVLRGRATVPAPTPGPGRCEALPARTNTPGWSPTDLIGCDLWRFHRALTTAADSSDPAARTTALQQAVTAYQGDLVEGADYDWALTEREDLRRRAITAASRLADLHQQTGDHQRAVDVLEQAIRWEPYNEELYQQSMRIQAELSHVEEIRRTYRRLELRMADLDDDPSEPTRQLRDQLLRMACSQDHTVGQ